jgi:hypothetical protein
MGLCSLAYVLCSVHKASHLKNIALSTAGAASSVYAVLSVGGPDGGGGSGAGKGIVHQSVVKRLGGPHPQWEQQFLFWLGEEGPEGTAPASSATGAHDGALHVRLHDRARGDECIGRLDINFVQLLSPLEPQSLPAEQRPMSPPAAAPRSITNDNSSSSRGVTRWLALTDRKDLRATVGWLCISASFKGKGLEEQEASPSVSASSAAAATTPIANGHAATATEHAEVAKPEEGEHAIPELTDPELIAAAASKLSAADASAEDDAAADPSEEPQSPSQPPAPISEVFTLLHSPKSSAPSIVLSLPNPYLHNAATSTAMEGADESASANNTRPIPPPPADPVTYQSAPGAEWPLPRQTPPAPGYPVSPAPPASSSTSLSRPTTRAGANTRSAFAAGGATATALPLSPTAAGSAAAGKEDAELHAAAAAATLAAELAQASLVTAYDLRHEHILQLLPRLPSGRFLCASCAGEGTAAVWHCVEAGCGFELHEQCLQEDTGAANDDDEEKEEEEEEAPAAAAGADHALNDAASPGPARRSAPELRMDRRHAHPLVWREQLYPSGTYLCGGCGGGGSGGAWHCRSCVFDLHPECMR